MNRIKNMAIVLLFIISFVSCNDWLNVDPKDKIGEREMFSTVKGYESVLNGVYRNMAESDLYGEFLSFGAINAMSHTYDITSTKWDLFKHSGEYRYNENEFKRQSDRLWKVAYNCIANANELIQQLEKESDHFFNILLDQRRLMMGEAYAARAYIHFDLLRLYAPSPTLDDGAKYIPYVDYYPCKFAERASVEEFLNKVVRDLEKAMELLSWDETTEGTNNFMNQWSIPSRGVAENNMFYGYRATRMNYVATEALLARVLLYRAGNEEQDRYKTHNEVDGEILSDREYAYKLASDVIGRSTYRFTEASDINDNKLSNRKTIKMPEELVFALWRGTQAESVKDYFASLARNYALADYERLYEDYDAYSDFRFLYFIYNSEEGYHLSNRWWLLADRDKEDPIIPMIRLSEVYYIASDAIFYKDRKKAVRLLCRVLNGRGNWTYVDNKISREEYVNFLITDARKEYAAEGKMFFMYKRLNEKVIIKADEEIELGPKFTLPLPESEFMLK